MVRTVKTRDRCSCHSKYVFDYTGHYPESYDITYVDKEGHTHLTNVCPMCIDHIQDDSQFDCKNTFPSSYHEGVAQCNCQSHLHNTTSLPFMDCDDCKFCGHIENKGYKEFKCQSIFNPNYEKMKRDGQFKCLFHKWRGQK